MKQKDIFLQSEADNWFLRNEKILENRPLPDSDLFLSQMLTLTANSKLFDWENMKILEIGCGDGRRLEWIKNNLGSQCFGIDPSSEAIKSATLRGINAQVSTADKLPYESNYFDMIVFGFCLYLCDRDDLMLIASEADRVLKSPGWLFIIDFYSQMPIKVPYKHHEKISTFKMDYKNMFSWHPSYSLVTQNIRSDHSLIVDEKNEWTSFTALRKLHD